MHWVEVLIHRTSERTSFGERVFTEVIKWKWGGCGGPTFYITGVLTQRRNLNTISHKRKNTIRREGDDNLQTTEWWARDVPSSLTAETNSTNTLIWNVWSPVHWDKVLSFSSHSNCESLFFYYLLCVTERKKTVSSSTLWLMGLMHTMIRGRPVQFQKPGRHSRSSTEIKNRAKNETQVLIPSGLPPFQHGVNQLACRTFYSSSSRQHTGAVN